MPHSVCPALIAFDMAGTTIDEHDIVYTTLREVTTAAGASYDEDTFASWTGTEKRGAIAGLLGSDDEAEIDRVHTEFVGELSRRYAARPPVPCPGIEAAFERLRGLGVRLALTTGFDRPTTDQLLDALGWRTGADGQIDAVVCATEVERGRPAPDLIRAVMREVGVDDPADVWAVGDTAADLKAAAAAGAVGVGVLTGAGTRELLSAHPHRWILDTAAEVADLAEATDKPVARP
ncbi:HAD hydrolase-like protein [Naumannella sp. ID2617S]|nr:HAD hydrolase-like protein [Naumannella sp. ID2617S]